RAVAHRHAFHPARTGVCVTNETPLRSGKRHPLPRPLRGEVGGEWKRSAPPECPVLRGACPSPFALSPNEKMLAERGNAWCRAGDASNRMLSTRNHYVLIQSPSGS